MTNPQHEPTMEEILASIRKIISEDSPASSHEAQPNGEADVLDLTQEVHEAPSPELPAAANADCHAQPGPLPAPEHLGDGLFSQKARAATEEAVAGLSSGSARADERSDSALRETVEETFERAVQEAFEPLLQRWLAGNSEAMLGHMKPVVREWLDEHFPAMLENAVKAELARARSRNRR